MENIEAIAAIVGLINGFRLWQAPDKGGFYLFAGAVIVGLVFGYLEWFSLSGVEAGLIAALASSGVYRVAEKVSGK